MYKADELCQKIFGFHASLWYLTSCTNFMVMRPAVPEILGGCQKEQIPLTVNMLYYVHQSLCKKEDSVREGAKPSYFSSLKLAWVRIGF